MEYSEKEMAIVTQACISIFVLVAKSDGTISKAEEKTFSAFGYFRPPWGKKSVQRANMSQLLSGFRLAEGFGEFPLIWV